MTKHDKTKLVRVQTHGEKSQYEVIKVIIQYIILMSYSIMYFVSDFLIEPSRITRNRITRFCCSFILS